MNEDLRSLGVVPLDSIVRPNHVPIPNADQLPFDWPMPCDGPTVVPRIDSLFELESRCAADGPEKEFWEWAAVAAAKDLGVYVQWGEWLVAINYLKGRRNGTLLDFSAADRSICEEVNLFLSRIMKDGDMSTATSGRLTKPKPKKPTEQLEDLGLMSPEPAIVEQTPGPTVKAVMTHMRLSIRLDMIDDSPFQTRAEPSAEEIGVLAHSIETVGLLKPLRVRPGAKPGRYELIGGHRRSRAVRSLKWTDVPCDVVSVDDATASAAASDFWRNHTTASPAAGRLDGPPGDRHPVSVGVGQPLSVRASQHSPLGIVSGSGDQCEQQTGHPLAV